MRTVSRSRGRNGGKAQANDRENNAGFHLCFVELELLLTCLVS